MISRIATVSLAFALTSAACAALDETRNPIETQGPDAQCGDCYVVNAAITGAGPDVFVGGYVGESERGFVRRQQDGAWGTVAESDQLGGVRQLWASGHELYFVARAGVHRIDLESSKSELLERDGLAIEGEVVWSAAPDDVVVLGKDAALRFDGNTWHDQPLVIGTPKEVSGAASDDLYALGTEGAIVHSDGESWRAIEAPVGIQDIWAEGATLLAVTGEDHPDGTTGAGEILRLRADRWEVLREAPEDALLGIASAGPDSIYAVGAIRIDGDAHPVVWHFDGQRWSRHVIAGSDAFLWDAWCSPDGPCYAVGSDNAFIELADLD